MASRRTASLIFRAGRTTQKSTTRPFSAFLTPASRYSACPAFYASPIAHVPLRAPFSASASSSDSPSSPSSAPPDAGNEVASHDFSSMKKLVSAASPSRVIVDVREPVEVRSSGRIPGAVNMPINSAPEGLFLPADEFEDRFGFAKPKADQEVVFYCKAGVRSRAASRVAKMAGYRDVAEYPGSWVDWEQNGGDIEK